MKKRLFALLLAAILLLALCPAVLAEDAPVLSVEGIREISKHGNVRLNLSHAEVLACFDLGDIVTVSFGEQTVEMPVCSAYSDVDSGCTVLCLCDSYETGDVELSINMRSFASVYGLASQPDADDPTYWEYGEDYSADTVFTIRLKEKAGYLNEYTVRHLESTDVREDYLHLSDTEFANFRMVRAGSIGRGVLYRSSSPVNPANCRSSYSDTAAEAAGITQFIDLDDNEEALSAFAGYADSYFAAQSHFAKMMTANITGEDNRDKMAEAFRYMALHPGVYGVFCKYGQDRTGYIVALLECLMGADYAEIADDYMLTFRNYYGVAPQDAAYTAIADGNILRTLETLLGVDPRTSDLADAAERFMAGLGLTVEEIAMLRANLSENVRPFDDVFASDWFCGDAAFAGENGLILGTAEGIFSPSVPLSRGMAAVILCRMAGDPVTSGLPGYSDVDVRRDDAGAICWTSAEGIVTGYSSGTFGPDDPVTREQLITMLYRYATQKGLDISAETDLSAFKDTASVSVYALPAMKWAAACGILCGDDGGCLNPASPAARAEAAAILHRFCSVTGAL